MENSAGSKLCHVVSGAGTDSSALKFSLESTEVVVVIDLDLFSTRGAEKWVSEAKDSCVKNGNS